jgi:hypothetical protein
MIQLDLSLQIVLKLRLKRVYSRKKTASERVAESLLSFEKYSGAMLAVSP